jgi:hypothetical protein
MRMNKQILNIKCLSWNKYMNKYMNNKYMNKYMNNKYMNKKYLFIN